MEYQVSCLGQVVSFIIKKYIIVFSLRCGRLSILNIAVELMYLLYNILV